MPYIGRGPSKSGAFRTLDDISGSFNGSTTSFALTVGSAALTVGLPETLMIAVDGVMQEPGSAYTISGSNIVFGAAPQADATFWGVELGDVGGLADRATTQSAGDNSTKVATTAYVDAQVATEDTIAELNDTTITSIASGEVLKWNGSAWVNNTLAELGVLPVANPTFTGTLTVGSAAITEAELEILDGATVTTTELNLLDALDRGSILYGNSSGVTTVLGQGTTDQVLTSDGTDISWEDASGTTINNNANNLVITGSGTANTLEAEANLTYDGAELSVGSTSAKLVLDQGTGDGYLLELRSTGDVAHGLSGYNTATYGQFMKKHADSGMLQIWGFSDANANQAIGLSLVGVSGIAANTTKTTAAIGIVEILGGIKGNGNISNPASNGNILVVRDANSGAAKMIVDQEGDVRVNEGSSTYMPSVTKGVAKAWLSWDYAGTTPTNMGSYNVTSIAQQSTGHVRVTLTNALSSSHAAWLCQPSAGDLSANVTSLSQTTTSCDFKLSKDNSGFAVANLDGSVAVFGVSN